MESEPDERVYRQTGMYSRVEERMDAMSGGSFSYLYRKDPADILVMQDDLQAMRDALLNEHKGEDAAAEVEDMIATCRQFKLLIQRRMDRLRDVMHAVEWCRSGDTGPDHVQEALTEYRKGMR
jgi:hypothetical protein